MTEWDEAGSLFKSFTICYKPSFLKPSKIFEFDFHTYMTDMTVSNGNLRFLWHPLTEDR
jgi:hypothetical protein